METMIPLLIGLVIFLAGYCFKLNSKISQLKMDILKREQEFKIEQEQSNKKAVETSRRVIKGKVTEELAPLLPGFPFVGSDCKFFGQPLDYIIFNGYTEVRDNNGDEIEIIFIDIKTGKANLSKPQRKIKEAIINKRISGMTLRIENGIITLEPWRNYDSRKTTKILPDDIGESTL